MSPAETKALTQAVQRNCDIADARFAGDFTMCIYLLKMREYFRWEVGAELNDSLSQSETGAWVSGRERHWERLEDQDYQPVSFQGMQFDPFESDAINRHLSDSRLAYGAGLGLGGRAHFFLGDLERQEQFEGYRLTVVGQEYARDLPSPPAMMQGGHIIVRRESLRRLLWERYDQWVWNRPDNAMAKAVEAYGFEIDPMSAVDAMTNNELDMVLLHEIGEIKAGQMLGADRWSDLMVKLPRSKVELMLRAVKDHLADCISTIPGLIESDRPASIHFFIGNLSGMRKHLFPKLLGAYEHYLNDGNLTSFAEVAAEGLEHWKGLGMGMLELCDGEKDIPVDKIECLFDGAVL